MARIKVWVLSNWGLRPWLLPKSHGTGPFWTLLPVLGQWEDWPTLLIQAAPDQVPLAKPAHHCEPLPHTWLQNGWDQSGQCELPWCNLLDLGLWNPLKCHLGRPYQEHQAPDNITPRDMDMEFNQCFKFCHVHSKKTKTQITSKCIIWTPKKIICKKIMQICNKHVK